MNNVTSINKIQNNNLPNDFQKSEYLVAKGQIDLIVQRKDLSEKISPMVHRNHRKG